MSTNYDFSRHKYRHEPYQTIKNFNSSDSSTPTADSHNRDRGNCLPTNCQMKHLRLENTTLRKAKKDRKFDMFSFPLFQKNPQLSTLVN